MLLRKTIHIASSLHFLMTVQKAYSFENGMIPGTRKFFFSQGTNDTQPNLNKFLISTDAIILDRSRP